MTSTHTCPGTRPRAACRPVRPSAIVLGVALATAACSGTTDGGRPTAELRIGVSVPPTDVEGLGFAAVAANLVSEPFVSIGIDGRPAAKIATAWQWSDDRLSLRLTLDPTIRFHDGGPLDAAAAARILRSRLADPEMPAITYGSVASVEPDGSHGLLIRLTQPEAFFLADLASSSIVSPENERIGTGPFRYRAAAADQKESQSVIELAAFDDYYRGKPAVARVVLKRYEEHRSAWAALMRGDIDALHEASPTAMDFLEKQTTVRSFPHTRPYFIQVLFNMRHAALRKKAVRQALSHAIDRQRIIDAAVNGHGLVADSPIWPELWAYSRPRRTYAPNTEAAKLLLDGAGHRLRRQAEPGRMKSRFHFVCLTLATDARYEKIGLVLQKQLHDIGVDMEVVALPWPRLLERIRHGDFDAILLERTSGRSLAWTYLNYHSSHAPAGYDAADAVLERLRHATTEAATRAGVDDLLGTLHDDPPALFLYWPVVARAVSSRFVVPYEPGRDVMGSVRQWTPAPGAPAQ